MSVTNGRPEGGWIKLFYRFRDWEWYGHPNMVVLFVHLLLTANYRPQSRKGRMVPRGCLVATVDALRRDTGLSVQQVRTCLKKLVSTNEITITATNAEHFITICKYDVYQPETPDTEAVPTNGLTNGLTNDAEPQNPNPPMVHD